MRTAGFQICNLLQRASFSGSLRVSRNRGTCTVAEMALFGRTSEFSVENTGKRTTVPPNDTAYLMYYLHCVERVLSGTIAPRLRDYQNYQRLSDRDRLAVVRLCETYSKEELDGKLFFNEPSLCGELENDFFEITAARRHLFVSESVLIAGRRQTATTIMVYKQKWWTIFYDQPISAERARVRGL